MRWLVPVVVTLFSAGCLQAAEQGIEDARNSSTSATPQESVAPDVTATPSVPSSSPTPAASPVPSPTPATSPPPPAPVSAPETPLGATPPPTPSSPTPTPSSLPSPSPSPAPSPAPSPSPETWPREGSFVSYTFRTGQAFAGSEQSTESYGNMTWSYHNGDWTGDCVEDVHDHTDGTTWQNTTQRVHYDASHPPHWPLFDTKTPPAVGAHVDAWMATGCRLEHDDRIYKGPSTESVGGRDVPTFVAEGDYPPEQPWSFTSGWSRSTGLVLTWSYAHGGMAPYSNRGSVTSTDAPL